MKNLLFIYLFLIAFTSFSQESTFIHKTEIANNEAYSFIPPIKLLNKEIWSRVADTRFECNFLRLAVEYKNNEYVLYQMDGNKLELSRASDYKIIGDEIAMNTFSVSPGFSGRAN